MDKEITFKSDLLNRRLLAENLTKIIEKTNKMNVIAIDSSWGSGKTTFIKMWNNMLLEDGYKDKFRTLYFNAWKNDYLKDPLLALITEIDNECKKNNKISAKVFNGIINNGKKIIKPVINVSLKVATGGVLGNDDLKFGDIQEKVYNDAVQEKEKREEFIKYLEDNSKSDDYKTIFFIDELDRCRPLFAIELLETIKHLFKAKNIYFVIAIDKEQLSYSISTLYGHGMDSNGYLRRFFDLEYKMPIVDKRKYITIKSNEIFRNYNNTIFFRNFLQELMIRDNFSFRDIDKTYKYIELLMPFIKLFNEEEGLRNQIFYIVSSYIIAVLIDIKIKHSNLYNKIINLNYIKEDKYIDELMEFNNIEELNFRVNMISDNNLKTILIPVMKLYLKLIKISNYGSNDIGFYDEEEFTVGLKDPKGGYFYGHKFNLTRLILDKEFNFIKIMEFIDNF